MSNKKAKEKKEIQVHSFIWEGMPYTITFLPDDNGWDFQLMYEQSSKIITKGKVEY
jgi:hypothetical protein